MDTPCGTEMHIRVWYLICNLGPRANGIHSIFYHGQIRLAFTAMCGIIITSLTCVLNMIVLFILTRIFALGQTEYTDQI